MFLFSQVLLFLFLFLLTVPQYLVQWGDFNTLEDTLHMTAETGFKKWDVYSLLIVYIPTHLTPFVYIYLYRDMDAKLTQFVEMYQATCSALVKGSHCTFCLWPTSPTS
jgi:hypothetical protein